MFPTEWIAKIRHFRLFAKVFLILCDMDVELLSKMVSELVVDHDSVALPGLGTFVAVEMPASFSDRGFTINPPYRKLTFMSGGGDDGLLAQLYAKSNSVDIDSSKAILAHFLSEMKEVLKDTKNLALPGFGRLRATKDNTFFFVPDEDLDIYPEGFGLPAVSLKNTSAVFAGSGVAAATGGPDIRVNGPSGGPATPEPETVAVQEPIATPEPETVITKAPETTPEPEGCLEPERVAEPEPKAKTFRWWIPVIAVVVLAAVALAVFLILAQVAPDFIDKLLYTPEELKIIYA